MRPMTTLDVCIRGRGAVGLALALEAHRRLGCRGCSRADFRWDDERGVDGLFLLEVNTQPGMTPLSLVPEQARQIGMSYAELVQAIVDEAMASRALAEREVK